MHVLPIAFLLTTLLEGAPFPEPQNNQPFSLTPEGLLQASTRKLQCDPLAYLKGNGQVALAK